MNEKVSRWANPPQFCGCEKRKFQKDWIERQVFKLALFDILFWQDLTISLSVSSFTFPRVFQLYYFNVYRPGVLFPSTIVQFFKRYCGSRRYYEKTMNRRIDSFTFCLTSQ